LKDPVLAKSIENQKRQRDSSKGNMNYAYLNDWAQERKVVFDTSGRLQPYPADSTKVSVFHFSIAHGLYLIYSPLKFSEHIAKLAKEGNRVSQEFCWYSNFTSKICWQGYTTGWVAVPVGRRMSNGNWRPHLIPVVFLVGRAEDIPQRSTLYQYGKEIMIQALWRESVYVPSPVIKQLNVDWIVGSDKVVTQSLPDVHVVTDLNHLYADVDKKSKKYKVPRPAVEVKKLLRRFALLPTKILQRAAWEVQFERIRKNWKVPKFADYLKDKLVNGVLPCSYALDCEILPGAPPVQNGAESLQSVLKRTAAIHAHHQEACLVNYS